MNRPMEHQRTQARFPVQEKCAVPETTLEFGPRALLVLRDDQMPLRVPIRKDARTLRLLCLLVLEGENPRDLSSPTSAWVSRDVLLRAMNPESLDAADCLKKSLRNLKSFLAENGLGQVENSGGMYRFVAPHGERILARMSD